LNARLGRGLLLLALASPALGRATASADEAASTTEAPTVPGEGQLGPENAPPAPKDAKTEAATDESPKLKFFPLPMYTTVPNEGSTYGFLPVFLKVGSNERILSITAPSVSWNSSAGFTGTYRYYRYLHELESWHAILSASTHVNRSMWFQYDDDRREPKHDTYNVLVRIRRNLFYRFFGLGPNTTEAAESSYTRVSAIIAARVGRNLSRNFNVGAFFEARADKPEVHAIKGLPETQQLFPDAPGLGGAAFLRQGLAARYDTREEGDYALDGFASELDGSIAEGVTGGTGVFGQLIWNTRVVKQELDWLQGGARLYWRQLIGDNTKIPFYDQASLGGELLLRGFQEDRFIDMGAWELEFEQRIRLYETHLFGVVSDWRLDPFVAAGQVYGPDAGPFSHVRYSAGLGLRAWIKPDILGRVDLAWGGEGIRAYVVLGYPY
jgi:hypothetical protein